MLNKLFILLFLACVSQMSAAETVWNGVSFIPSDSSEIREIIVDRNKSIKKYPALSKVMEVNIMTVEGRSPVNEEHFIYNSLVHFMVYVLEGTGELIADNKIYRIKAGDVLDVPPKTRFAAFGQGLKYMTIENPAWYSGQFSIVDRNNNLVK